MDSKISIFDKINIYFRTALKILRGGGTTDIFETSQRNFPSG